MPFQGDRHRNVPLMQDDVSDYEGFATLKMIYPESSDYKLTFGVSSDSSSLDDIEDSSSTCSSTNRHSISLDDCDWDYFEPSAATTTKTIFRDIAHSPFASPNVQRRRTAISDTIHTTDEEFLATHSSSPTSSDGIDIRRKLSRFKRTFRHTVNKGSSSTTTATNSNNSSCTGSRCDCGHQPQYVPIPVPVPIFVIGDDANSSDVRALQKKQAAELFQLWNTAAPDLLLQAHRQRTQIDAHKHIASDFLRKYMPQVESTSNHSKTFAHQAMAMRTNSQTSVAHTDASSSHRQENNTEQRQPNYDQENTHTSKEKATAIKATTISAAPYPSECIESDCTGHINGNGNTNTALTTQNDRSEQMHRLSTGPTVDLSIPTTKSAIASEKGLNHSLLNSEINNIRSVGVPSNAIEQTTNKNRDVNIIGPETIVNNSLIAFNLINDFTTATTTTTTKSKTSLNQCIAQQKHAKHNRELTKCSNAVVARKPIDTFVRDDMASTNVNEMAGYLRSESMFSSSSDSSDGDSTSDDSGSDIETNRSKSRRSKSIKRNYDVLNGKTVNETEKVTADDDDEGGSSDCDVESTTHDQPSCSSAPEASESDHDHPKYTSLADRRPKPKGFYKVFVVNKKATGSSDSDSDSSTNVNSSSTESSDNDTDTEKIVLNFIRPIHENCTESAPNYSNENNEIVLCSIKRLNEDEMAVCDTNSSTMHESNALNCENTIERGTIASEDDEENENERSLTDEHNRTVIEKMPIDENSCETKARTTTAEKTSIADEAEGEREVNAIATATCKPQNEQVDLHNQSTAAIRIDEVRTNMDLDSECITVDAVRSQAQQMVQDLCETLEQKLNADQSDAKSEQQNANIENDESRTNSKIHENTAMAAEPTIKTTTPPTLAMAAAAALETIKTLQTDPVSMNGFVSKQPVHGKDGVDDILSNRPVGGECESKSPTNAIAESAPIECVSVLLPSKNDPVCDKMPGNIQFGKKLSAKKMCSN